jgi:hypothetical protein
LHPYSSHADRTPHGSVNRCLIVCGAHGALVADSNVSYTRNTICGPISPDASLLDPQDKNLILPPAVGWHDSYRTEVPDMWANALNQVVYPYRGVFWPTRDLGGIGCYDYDPVATQDYAKEVWDRWWPYEPWKEYLGPHFPGDPLPPLPS